MITRTWEADSVNYMTSGSIDNAIAQLDKEADDYFVPNDPKVAYAMEHFDVEARKELDKVIKKMNWGKKGPPKRVIASF